MSRRRSFVWGAAAVLLAAGAGSGPGFAATDREAVRLIVLDTCVMSEWKKRTDTDPITDECKCASAYVAKKMTAARVKTFADKLGKEDQAVWDAAAKACFKS